MGQKLGTVPPFLVGELGPHLAQCGLDRGPTPYQVPSWSIEPFGHNRQRPKTGGLCPLFWGGGAGSPSNTKVAWAEAYLHTKWHLNPCGRLATTDMGRKLGGCAPLGRGSWVPILHSVARAEACLHAKFHLDPSNHFATVHQHYRQDRQTDRTTVR